MTGAEPPEWCDIIQQAVAAADCARYRAVRNSLQTGSAAFNAPKQMVRGDTVRIHLVIDRAAGSARPARSVDALEGDTVAFPTRVGRFMSATLSGEGFAVKALSTEQQDLFVADAALWEWDVTARTAGKHRILTLKTFVHVPAPDGSLKAQDFSIEDRPIDVVVKASEMAADTADTATAWFGRGTNLFKALAGLLAAAGAAWLAFRKLRGPAA
jgi:hypothetical protein